MKSEDKFWFVCRKYNSTVGPRVQHPTEERAEQEAKRLAGKYPGEEFAVLEAKKSFVTPPAIIETQYT